MLFTQAVVKTHNFQAPVNLSVPLREPHHCHRGHCPVFGAKLDLDLLPFNCCKTLIQPGIYLKRETHNHVHSQRLPGWRRRVNAAQERLASWESLNTRNLIILKRRAKVTLQALTLSTPLDPNSFSHYQKVMLFQDKQSISTSSKRKARERSTFPTCIDDRDVTHVETHNHTCRKEQQLIREHAVWVDGGKFTINVRTSDVCLRLTFWTRKKV